MRRCSVRESDPFRRDRRASSIPQRRGRIRPLLSSVSRLSANARRSRVAGIRPVGDTEDEAVLAGVSTSSRSPGRHTVHAINLGGRRPRACTERPRSVRRAQSASQNGGLSSQTGQEARLARACTRSASPFRFEAFELWLKWSREPFTCDQLTCAGFILGRDLESFDPLDTREALPVRHDQPPRAAVLH